MFKKIILSLFMLSSSAKALNWPSFLKWGSTQNCFHHMSEITLEMENVLFLEPVYGPTTLFCDKLKKKEKCDIKLAKLDNITSCNGKTSVLSQIGLPQINGHMYTYDKHVPLNSLLNNYSSHYYILTPNRLNQTGVQCGFHAVMNMLIMQHYLLGKFDVVQDTRECYEAVISSFWYNDYVFGWWNIDEIDHYLSLLILQFASQDTINNKGFYYYKIQYDAHNYHNKIGTHFTRQGNELTSPIEHYKNIFNKALQEGKAIALPFIIYEQGHNYSLVIGQDITGKKIYVLMDSYYNSNRAETLVKELAELLK